MKYAPIIFSGPMVLALLDGRKTQTRRLASSPLANVEPGTLLYVRESVWQSLKELEKDADGRTQWGDSFEYHADGKDPLGAYWRSRPSIHMPAKASRLTLRVQEVRRERLLDISPADAVAEGLRFHSRADNSANRRLYTVTGEESPQPARNAFWGLWDALHDKDGERSEDNPEIVALTFEVIHANFEKVITENAG